MHGNAAGARAVRTVDRAESLNGSPALMPGRLVYPAVLEVGLAVKCS